MLDEDNLTRSEHSLGLDVVAPVAVMVAWVTDKDTRQGPWTELVVRCGHGVGVAEAPKHSQLAVVRRCAEEVVVRCRRTRGVAGVAIQ